MASFTKEVNRRLAKRPLKTNGRLTNRQLTSLVKEATGVGRVFQPIRKWQLQIWSRTSTLHTGGYRLQTTIRWHWRLPSQNLVIRTGVTGGPWLVTIVFWVFNYCCLISCLFITWTATAILKTCEISMAGRDVRNIGACFLFRIRGLQNGGGVKFVDFWQKFDGQPILKLLLKYGPKMSLPK